MIWTLPSDDTAYGARWQMIKRTFVKHQPKKVKGGIWQRRYWECPVESQDSYAMYAKIIAEAPVAEGLVKNAADWPYGSYGRSLSRGRAETV